MDIYLLIATLSLVIQLVVLVLLITAYMFKRQKNYRQHGLLMFLAVILHAVIVFLIMVPSFNAIVFTETGLSLIIIALSVIHGILGIVALALGIWIVAAWRLRTSLQHCAPKRKIMRVTIIAWLTAIALGIILYFSLYIPLIV
jgi:uncharacterized membrane protein YozB (DUF420 family)